MKCLLVPRKYLTESSILDDSDKILIIRPEVENLFHVLKENVMTNSGVRWVVGPPGVGKSFATFAFTCTLLDPCHVITWIFLSRHALPSFVRFADGRRASGEIASNSEEFKHFLRSPEYGKRMHSVVLDGYTDEDQSHSWFPRFCHRWVLEDMEHRRHISIKSMSSCKQLHPSLKAKLRLRQEYVGSWTKNQYREALKNDAFLNQVKNKLDAHVEVSSLGIEYEHMMESKFFFAGECCRYMFDYTTKEVIEDISLNLNRCAFPYLSGSMGACGAISHLLFSSQACQETSSFVPVSSYAATTIAKKLPPTLISNLRTVLREQMNPSMEGHLFEMWFFAKLEHGNLKFRWKWAQHQTWWTMNRWSHGVWRQSKFTTFDPDSSLPPICTFENAWLKPSKWNPGGYDAVFLEPKTNSITFVQLTRSETHTFKPKYFRKLLDNIHKNWLLNLKFLDIYFAVPSSCASNFRIEGLIDPDDYGLFEQYFVGSDTRRRWTSHRELTCTRICTIKED